MPFVHRCKSIRRSAVAGGAAALFACLLSGPSSAASDDGPEFPDVVLAASTLPYKDAEAGSVDEWKDCDWNRSMLAHLVERSNGHVLPAGTTTSTSRRTLALVTQTMHIVGGSTWSGPKWLVLDGMLTEDAKPIGSFEARRQSYLGAFRACTTIRELADDIADDIVEWLGAPRMNSKLGDAK